ncbi:unnamed protein product [Miscanthus lutarioriparius]|uniref:ENT domain-containing protein n=1 Tax=Miscanthus lutarioriparius TaxID=422564 RepID=A0A811P5J7_9POAL|nr:unnamed protein product [Miscanthus lutarioriparius]
MRIRKGNPVEVWTQEAGSPVGAWRSGEVTWGNGHSYTLRWHDGDGEVSGRISRKSVRPRPPPAPVPRDLDAGDMVEVFDDDDCLWKCAEVQGPAAANDRHFDVKIVGAAKVLTVPAQRLRVRQVLLDDVWVALHKKRSFGMLGSASDTTSHVKGFEDNTKRLKQEPIPNVCVNNKRDEMSGEDCDNDVGIGINPDDDDDHQQQQQQQHERKDEEEEEDDDDDDDDDSDSDSSSDDSSSGSDSDSRTRSIDAGKDCPAALTTMPCNVQKAGQLQPVKKEQPIIKEEQPVKKEQHCDDIAESREIKSEPLKHQTMGATTVREHIHHLELEAYAALMKAFHACGNALSWEKEGLLSDLRVHLHISNDEHLQVLNVILNRKRRTGGHR